jgi:capsular polysaccharide biosynthesis protein
MGAIFRKVKHQLVIINAIFDALKQEFSPFLRAYCYFSTTQVLKLEQSQSTSYLGLNQVKFCHCILNTWRNTAASVDLDCDSTASWVTVLYFGHRFGQDPI